MVYTIEDGFIKEAREFEISGSERKEVKHFIIKPLKGKKLPATIDIEKDNILQEFVEFSYNDQDQITEIKKGEIGNNMKFKANSRRRVLEYEKMTLDFWKRWYRSLVSSIAKGIVYE